MQRLHCDPSGPVTKSGSFYLYNCHCVIEDWGQHCGEQLVFTLGRALPLRAITYSGECTSDHDCCLPLLWLPANERQCVFIDRDDPHYWIRGYARRPRHRRITRRASSFFLSTLQELDVYKAARHGSARQCSTDNARRRVLVRAVYRNLHERKTPLGNYPCRP